MGLPWASAFLEVGVPERDIPPWNVAGENPPGAGPGVPQGVPEGVWALMTDGAEGGPPGDGGTWGEAADAGPPLMTDGEGAGEGPPCVWEGTMPGKTGVMGVAGGSWGGAGVEGVEPRGEGRGALLTPGVAFWWLAGLV